MSREAAAAAAARIGALVRHSTILLLREPGPLASRLVLPLAFLLLLHPLYQVAQGPRGGITQAVIATLVTFSLLALSIVGGSILTDRIWHTWERVRVTVARPAELIAGKAVPVLVALLAQQVLSLGGALVPLAALPQWVRHVAPASPGYWAVSALRAALAGGSGRTLECCAVLAGIAVAAGLGAVLLAGRGGGRSARL